MKLIAILVILSLSTIFAHAGSNYYYDRTGCDCVNGFCGFGNQLCICSIGYTGRKCDINTKLVCAVYPEKEASSE